jgi:hypothetical protein
MGVVFFVWFFRQLWSYRLGRGAWAALLPGIVPRRTMPAGVAGWSNGFRPRDGEVVHAFLRWLRVTDSVRSMIVVITTRK